MQLVERFLASCRSFMRLPYWVRLWLPFALGGVNLAAFFLTHTPIGYWAAWSTAFVLLVNGPIILMQQGWGKLLALPHLIVWIPLLTFVLVRFADPDVSSTEFYYGVALLMVNGISVVFDIADTWRWVKGERAVA